MLTMLYIYIPLVACKIHLLFVSKHLLCIFYHKSSDLPYSKKTRFFYKFIFIKIYNLYFLFLYIKAKVKIHYKRKKNKFRTICQTKNLTGKIWPTIWFYFTSQPKYYSKTYVEWKIIQTFIRNYIFQTIPSIFHQNISMN